MFTNEMANHFGFDKGIPWAWDKAVLRLEKETEKQK